MNPKDKECEWEIETLTEIQASKATAFWLQAFLECLQTVAEQTNWENPDARECQLWLSRNWGNLPQERSVKKAIGEYFSKAVALGVNGGELLQIPNISILNRDEQIFVQLSQDVETCGTSARSMGLLMLIVLCHAPGIDVVETWAGTFSLEADEVIDGSYSGGMVFVDRRDNSIVIELCSDRAAYWQKVKALPQWKQRLLQAVEKFVFSPKIPAVEPLEGDRRA